MTINNAGELSSYISSNGLSHIAAELPALIVCMDEYSRMCGGCIESSVRDAQMGKCRGLYINFVANANSYKTELLSKTGDAYITFTDNGQHIVTIRR